MWWGEGDRPSVDQVAAIGNGRGGAGELSKDPGRSGARRNRQATASPS
jgi:hypothetical protein